MPLLTMTAGTRARAAHINSNFALCLLTDTSRTCSVTHTWTASQTFTGGWTAGAATTVNRSATAIPAGIASALGASGIAATFGTEASRSRVVNVNLTSPQFMGVKMNGSFATPTAVITNDILADFAGIGYDGSAFAGAARGAVSVEASGNWNGTSHPTRIAFYVTASGSTSATTQARITTSGLELFGGGVTFLETLISTTAFATPSALSATQFTGFASTVSGATLMGFGTTHDVALKNRAGTTIIGITANTTGVTMAGALAITGALSGVTTIAASGTLTMTSANIRLSNAFNLTGNDTGGTAQHLISFSAADKVSIDAGGYGVVTGGSVTTSAPTGGAGAWELGIANAVSPTSPNRTITIEIGGTAYYLHAKTTND